MVAAVTEVFCDTVRFLAYCMWARLRHLTATETLWMSWGKAEEQEVEEA